MCFMQLHIILFCNTKPLNLICSKKVNWGITAAYFLICGCISFGFFSLLRDNNQYWNAE